MFWQSLKVPRKPFETQYDWFSVVYCKLAN